MLTKTLAYPALLATACTLSLGAVQPAQAQVNFDWATIGDAGNAPDPQNHTTNRFYENRFGTVDYEYKIAKHEVTVAQYTTFLNAVDPTGGNSLGLYHNDMAAGFLNAGGIAKTGTADGSRYAVRTGRDNTPVLYVNWYDSARFVNWLHNGQGGAGTTESGVYDMSLQATDPFAISRSANATYFLPSENEWYKASYYDARTEAQGGPTGDDNYWAFSTPSDVLPDSDDPTHNDVPDPTNVANMWRQDNIDNGYNDTYAVSDGVGNNNPLTDVGAYTQATSYYGTFDQTGGANEWTETADVIPNGTEFRVRRGGVWSDFVGSSSFGRDGHVKGPDFEFSSNGFRVAAPVPEPGSLALLALAAPLVLRRRKG